MTKEEIIKVFNTLLTFKKVTCTKDELEECCKAAIKALEQEPILEKIRTEIIERFGESQCAEECGCLYELLDIIDKYKAESEG